MKDWRRLSAEDLEQWRASPVALQVKAALSRSLDIRRKAATEAYWSGKAWPEEQRLAVRLAEEMLDDWFTASADDFNEIMETTDGQPQRDQTR